MKLETFIVWMKLGLLFFGTTLSALNVGLGQWSNDAGTPSYIQWFMIISGSLGAGFLAAYGVMSGSFVDWLRGKKDGSGAAPPPPVTPSGP